MTLGQQLTTADELWRLAADGQRHELIAGELHTLAPSGEEHGTIAARLTIAHGQHVLTHHLGRVVAAETGFLLTTDPDTVRAADLAFIGRPRAAAAGPEPGYRRGAPDLAVEVISPNDLYTEVEEKVAMWLAHGTAMVIVVNPRRRTVAVHRSPTQVRHLMADDTIEGEEIVPGWRLPVRELFAAGD